MAKILCVEDEVPIREDIAEELEEGGHAVIQAGNGEEALQLILEHEPDLVISDINMPKMNGAQLLVQLRKTYPQFDDMPFIFLTAFADRNDVLRGSKLGADDYLTKPIDFELLEVKVEQHLRNVARVRQKRERELMDQAATSVEMESSDSISKHLHSIKHIHNIRIVVLGKFEPAQKCFTDFLLRNKFNVTVFVDERAYIAKLSELPVHFTFLWNYTYDMHRAFLAHCGERIGKSICVRVFPEKMKDQGDVVPVASINNVLKLPVTTRQLKNKLVELIQTKISDLIMPVG